MEEFFCKGAMCECDLCGNEFSREEIHLDNEYNHLCPVCRKLYETLPIAIKANVERFLERNLF